MLSKEVTGSSKDGPCFLSVILEKDARSGSGMTNRLPVKPAMTFFETVFQSGIDVANDVAEDAGNAEVLLNDEISEDFDTS